MTGDFRGVVEDCVIMFMDIHDFSIALNTLGNKVYGFLQGVYEELGDIIVEHGGEIIKYMGDAILCIFPAASESQTIACARRLRKAFSNAAREWGIPQRTELEIGIGSGKVTAGIFGHRSLRQKDVFGEEVNRAAAIGHHRGIAITKSVYDRVKADYETRKLPGFEVKWQDEPLEVWEVVE